MDHELNNEVAIIYFEVLFIKYSLGNPSKMGNQLLPQLMYLGPQCV